VTAEDIIGILRQFRFRYASENELQAGIAEALEGNDISFSREVRINEHDRLDFLIGDIALETKIDGSAAALLRQVHRYAQSETVQSIIVVTDKARHRLPAVLNGKPVYVHSLLMEAL
jgi:hypothetical protein